jgi:DNA-binding winged helix-turn-helix (wHTH) protein
VKTGFRHYQFGDFLLDAEEGVLYRDGEPIPLARKVFDLLLLFVKSDGRVLSQDEIIQALWANTAVEQSNLKQSIYVLRRALGESSDENAFIKTLPKRGYRFLAEVRGLPCERNTVIAAEQTITDVFIEEEIIEEESGDAKTNALLPRNTPNRVQRHFARQLLQICLLSVIVLFTVGYGIYRYARAESSARIAPVNLENASWQKLTNAGDVHFAVISPDGGFAAYVALHENNDQSIRILNISNRSEMTGERMASSETRPPALRMMRASPTRSLKNFSGCSLASMHVTTATRRAGAVGRSPLSNEAAYRSLASLNS